MTGIAQVDQSQQIAESELQDQIAGAGAEPSFLVADNLPIDNLEGTDSATLSGPGLTSTAANSALASDAPVKADEEAYLENTSEYENAIFSSNVALDDDVAQLQNGSDKIDGSNPDIQDLVNDILEEAGLSEKPEGMTEEEYQQAIAEAIYNWLLENWEYAQDLGNDYWQSVAESLGLSGDCEDFAILLASMLIAAGLNPEDVAVIVDAEGDHAYVAIEIDGEVFILDGGEMQETDYASLDQLLADDSKVGAWFKEGSYGINNEDLDINTADDTTGGGGGGTNGDAIDAVNNLDGMLSDSILGFDEEEYYSENSDGYLGLDEDKLEKWEQWVLARTNALAALLMMLSSNAECKKLVDENFSGVPIEEAKHSYKEAYARKIGFLQKICRVAISKLFERINTLNKKRYEEEMQKIQAETESSGHKTENFFCGGSADIRETEKALQESAKYLNSTKSTLEAMQRAMQTLMSFLVATVASDDFTTLGIVAALQKFSDKIDQMSADVDASLQQVMDDLEDLPDPDVIAAVSFLNALFGNFGGMIVDALVANYGDVYDFADGSEYIEDCDMTSMIKAFRGKMMVLQNAQRGAMSLRMADRDLRNVVRESMTGLTGVKGDAEIVMRTTEGMLGHTMQVFDATASQLMLKVSLHNRTVQLTKDLQALYKAAPVRAISFAISLAMLVVSIVVTVLTWGAGAPLIVLAVVAVAAIAKAITDYFANRIANSIEGYAPPGADIAEPTRARGPGTTVIDALNNIELEQQGNMAAAAKNSCMGTTDDGMYYFDSASFALYEVKQKMFDNLIRMFFSVIKNGRDLKRIVNAEMRGTSAADSGAALLQNAVENVILQKQLIMSAIKFQHQEVVNARNIERQQELAEGEAGWGLVASIAGAVVGAFIGACIGLGAGAALGCSIGSALGSSVYQFVVSLKKANYNWNISPDKAQALRNYLQSQSNASTEAKLDAAELKAFENLLNNGIVSSGDDYYAVDFGLVTQTTSYLGRIYAAKEALAKARSLGSELRNIVKQEMTGVTVGKIGELTQAVNQANFSSAMKVLGALVGFLSTKAQVKNRGVDAQKNLVLASVNMGVSIAASIVGFAGCGSAGTAFGSVAQMMPAVMGLTNSLTTMISALTKVQKDDLGAYTNYDAKANVDKTGTRVNNAQTIDEKLAQMEYDIMMQMNSSMINSMTGGYEAVSSDAYNLSSEMKGVYNMKEALAVTRSIASAARDQVKAQMTGKRQGEVTFGKESIENYKQVALSTLDSLKSALDTIAQRHNQANAAVRQAIFAGIQAGFSAASIVCSAVAAGEQEGLADAQSGDNQPVLRIDAGGTAAAPAAAEAPAEIDAAADTAADAADARADAGSGTVGSASAGPGGPAGTTPSETMAQDSQAAQAQTADRTDGGSDSTPGRTTEDRQASIRSWSKAASACQMAGQAVNFIAALVQTIVDDSSHEGETSTTVSAEQKSKSSNGNRDVFTNMDNSDADIRAAEASISAFQVNTQAYAYLSQAHDQILEAAVSFATSIPNHVKQMHEIDTRLFAGDPGTELNRIVADGAAVAAADHIAAGVDAGRWTPETVVTALAGMEDTARAELILTALQSSEEISSPEVQAIFSAALTAIQNPQEAAAVTPTDAQPSARPTASIEYLDHLLAQREAALTGENGLVEQRAELQQQVQDLDAQIIEHDQHVEDANLDAQVQAVNGEVEAASTEEQVNSLDARLHDLEAQRDSLRAEQRTLIARKGELQEQIRAFDGRIEAYEANTESDIRLIDMRRTSASAEIDQIIADEGLTAEQADQDPRIIGLRQEIRDLQTRRQAFVQLTENEVFQQQEEQPLRAELEQVEARFRTVQTELSQTNQAITQTRRALDQKLEQLQSDRSTASVTTDVDGTTSAVAAGAFGKERVADAQDVITESLEDQPGVVEEQPQTLASVVFGDQPTGLALIRQQYKDSLAGDEIAGESLGVESMTGASVA